MVTSATNIHFLFYNYFNIKMHLNFLFRLMYFTSRIGLRPNIMLPCNMKCPENEAVSTASKKEIRCSVVVSGSFSEIIKKGFLPF